ncbi:hypothetical protein CBL_10883 [Carabus blaptoides fortunei]
MSLLESASNTDLAGSGDASGAKLIKSDTKLPKKLENEIKKFSTPTKIVSKNQITPRKRSLTMSDIPLQLNTRSPCLSKFKSSPLKMVTQSEYTIDRPRGIWRKELLARGFAIFIYRLWRIQRDQIKQYNEKVQDYEGIINKLRDQLSFLKSQMEKESSGYINALNIIQKQKSKLDVLTTDFIQLQEERNGYLNLTQTLEIEIQHLQSELAKTRNEWQQINNENLNYHEQIRLEREKLIKLRNEKQCLLDKTMALENMASQQQVNIKRLHDITEDLNMKLQKQLSAADTANKLKEQQIERSSQMSLQSEHLRERLKESLKKEKLSKMELVKTQNSILMMESYNNSLNDENNSLKSQLQEAEARLAEIDRRTWSNMVYNIARRPIKSLVHIAILLFPVMPRNAITYVKEEKDQREREAKF